MPGVPWGSMCTWPLLLSMLADRQNMLYECCYCSFWESLEATSGRAMAGGSCFAVCSSLIQSEAKCADTQVIINHLIMAVWECSALVSRELQAFTYNTAISACSKSCSLRFNHKDAKMQSLAWLWLFWGGRWVEALAVFAHMSACGVEPSVISFSAMMTACEKAARWQEARAVWKRLLRIHLQIFRVWSLITFISMVYGGVRTPRCRSLIARHSWCSPAWKASLKT